MVEVKQVITKETDTFVYGDRYEDGILVTSFIQSKENLWFLKPIREIMQGFGLSLDAKRYEEIENIFDGNISGFYYFSKLNDEAVKWLLGAVMAESKVTGKHFTNIIDAHTLSKFGEAVASNKIDRTFSKEIFREFLDLYKDWPIVTDVTFGEFEKYGYNELFYLGVNKSFDHILDDILKNPKYVLSDDSEIDEIVKKVVEDNKEQFDKIKTDPRMVNWFVGQCMKAGKGKLSPQIAKDKITAML